MRIDQTWWLTHCLLFALHKIYWSCKSTFSRRIRNFECFPLHCLEQKVHAIATVRPDINRIFSIRGELPHNWVTTYISLVDIIDSCKLVAFGVPRRRAIIRLVIKKVVCAQYYQLPCKFKLIADWKSRKHQEERHISIINRRNVGYYILKCDTMRPSKFNIHTGHSYRCLCIQRFSCMSFQDSRIWRRYPHRRTESWAIWQLVPVHNSARPWCRKSTDCTREVCRLHMTYLLGHKSRNLWRKYQIQPFWSHIRYL